MYGANINIKKGKILLYRVFDIAHEVSLKKAEESLYQNWSTKGKRLKLSRDPHNTVIMKEPPLSIDIGEEVVKTSFGDFKAYVTTKIWNYGALSVCVSIDIPENTLWKELVNWGCSFDDSPEVLTVATNARDFILNKISKSLIKPNNHDIIEDYSSYLIESIEEKIENKESNTSETIEFKDPQDLLKKVAIPELLIGENDFTLAEATRKSILKDCFQYSKQDLVIVDWNSALILDFTKKQIYNDYLEILEFSLTHLLELRIYDELLDRKLSDLYDSIEQKQSRALSNKYAHLSEEANQIYLEFSEFFEHIDNSIKTVGNSPLSLFFRETSREFRFSDWQSNVKSKMSSLAQITQLLQAEVNSRKSHIYEITIIVLILVEVIPLIYSWLKPYIIPLISI